jgi:hypothetical protein
VRRHDHEIGFARAGLPDELIANGTDRQRACNSSANQFLDAQGHAFKVRLLTAKDLGVEGALEDVNALDVYLRYMYLHQLNGRVGPPSDTESGRQGVLGERRAVQRYQNGTDHR